MSSQVGKNCCQAFTGMKTVNLGKIKISQQNKTNFYDLQNFGKLVSHTIKSYINFSEIRIFNLEIRILVKNQYENI